MTKVQSTIVSESRRVAGVNQEGFDRLNSTVQGELGSVERGVSILDSDLEGISKDIKGLEALSAASVAIQAAGFALTVGQLTALRGDVRKMHRGFAEQAKQVIEIQKLANSHLERLSDFAERTLATQERILEILVTSRTNEAKQLIHQGWANLKGGFDNDAFSRFIKSLEYDNTVYVTHAELARLCEQQKDDAQAEEHHRRAITFAESAGAEIEGFAHVQYAAFLERHKRFQECISQILVALGCLSAASDQPKQCETHARWRFYLAEIFAKSDADENAFEELRRSIELDARFFTAAMASECLQRLQPSLSQFLVQVDAESRASAVETLQEASTAISAIDVLDAKQAGDLQKTAASYLERLLFAPFEQVRTVHHEIRELKSDANALPEQISSEMLSQIENELRTIAAKIKDMSSRKAPEGIDLRFTFVLPIILGISRLSASGIGTMVICLCLSAAFLVAAVLAGPIRKESKQQAWEAERKEWEIGLAKAVDEFRKLKNEKLAVLKKALKKFDSPALRMAVARIEAIQEPPIAAL